MKKKIAIIISVLLVIVLICTVFAVYPLLNSAKLLNSAESLNRFNFTAEIELSEDRLTEKQLSFLDSIAGMLGTNRDDLMTLRLEGSLYDQSMHTVVYSNGTSLPVTEIYFDGNEAYINISMIYDIVYARLLEASPLLSLLLPQWTFGDFVSSKQLASIFGVNLDNVYFVKAVKLLEKPSFIYCLLLLKSMDRENIDGADVFSSSYGDINYSLNITGDENGPIIDFEGWCDGDSVIENFNGRAVFYGAEEVTIPDSLVSQDTIDGLAKVWGYITELYAKYKEYKD